MGSGQTDTQSMLGVDVEVSTDHPSDVHLQPQVKHKLFVSELSSLLPHFVRLVFQASDRTLQTASPSIQTEGHSDFTEHMPKQSPDPRAYPADLHSRDLEAQIWSQN